MNKLASFLVFVFVLTFSSLSAQSKLHIDLDRTYSKYDLEGAEIYFLSGNDSLYLTKTNKYNFQFDPASVLQWEDDSVKKIKILLISYKYYFSFFEPINSFRHSKNFMIRINKNPKRDDIRFGSELGCEWVQAIKTTEIIKRSKFLARRKRKREKKKRIRRENW